jgi:hypothetical protein
MTEETVDLHHLIELIDAALTSNDPTVKKALKKFLFIAALALDGSEEDRVPGPIEKILNDLEQRLGNLERKTSPYSDKYGGVTTNPPPFGVPGTGTAIPSWPGTTWGGGTTWGSTSYTLTGDSKGICNNTASVSTTDYSGLLKKAYDELTLLEEKAKNDN